ncbi:MAG: hypothetical protein IJ787_06915 [Bacilli bacterium]|nr:hypothetical protein [Bacilli bacterium]
MDKAIVEFNSGQFGRYSHEVAPLERKLERNNKVNWAICLAILLLTAVAGVVVGFLALPTLLGMFTGLLGGSIGGMLLMLAYYFFRSSDLAKTKNRAESGLSSCKASYQGAYKIPKGASNCEIFASDFLSKEYFGPSLIYVRDNGCVSIVAPDYEHERNEIRYTAKSVISYSLFSDSRVLIQSEEGYVVLSPEAKNTFVSSGFPLLCADSNRLFELSNTTIRAFTRPRDHVQKCNMAENPTWKTAMDALSSVYGKGGA